MWWWCPDAAGTMQMNPWGFRRQALVAAVSLMTSPVALAQQWAVYSGAAGRVEYNDNYFFTAPVQNATGPSAQNPESAFVFSAIPFVAAARRTEVSEVTALLSLGYNKVWGISPTEDYWSGSLALNGILREERATWGGNAAYLRSPQLQNAVVGDEVVLIRTYTDTATLGGSYTYAISDQWSAEASVGALANRYDSVEGFGSQSDDAGYNIGGKFDYRLSEATRVAFTLGYSYYSSDVTRSHAVTTTVGAVHRFSPQLSASLSAGGFWLETTAEENLPGAAVPVVSGEKRNDNGTFFGGNLGYEYSEDTRFDLAFSQGLSPTGVGVISKSTNAWATLSHRFSDRLTGRLGGSYARTTYPVALDDGYRENTINAQAGISYRLAEQWKLDVGYQYTRSQYSQTSSEPSSNVFFIGLGYNWPGSTFSDWIGSAGSTAALPGAGPLALPGQDIRSTPVPAPPSGTSTEPRLFDGLTLP